MKNAVCYLLLMGFLFTAQAQKVHELKEVNITDALEMAVVKGSLDGLIIREIYVGEFHKDPIKFVIKNFDARKCLDLMQPGFDLLEVNFKTAKGQLNAEYDLAGELISTSQVFKNIPLPPYLRQEMVKYHKGWEITETIYRAKGIKDQINKELYVIKLKKDNKNKTIRIKPALQTRDRISLL